LLVKAVLLTASGFRVKIAPPSPPADVFDRKLQLLTVRVLPAPPVSATAPPGPLAVLLRKVSLFSVRAATASIAPP
jgi:hypothetical protein